ncbi:MAG: cysteine--tRNA ligase [Clostridia bacterium]
MIKVYNTLTKRKETLVPREGNKISMYACGITVSGDAHIGHGYQALIYDIIRKYLEKRGYDVTYARNYTDVDDKIIARSRETGIPADKYAEMMIEKINNIMARFEVDDPDIWLKATCNIENIIEFIKALEAKGYAYPTEKGDVYFSVEKFSSYGKLSNRNLEDAKSSGRIESDEQKNNNLDFALWKSAKTGEIAWPSPWGDGRPGWHIECSAMNMAAFGEQIDIHGGGRDLIFPHHENEIAQTEALTGKQFVKYWIHNGLIKVNGQKMSKSLGNSLFLDELLNNFTAETVKFALLQTNYRNDINVTDDLFPSAEKHLYGFYQIMLEAEKSGLACDEKNTEIDDEFNACMDDDFNTALAIGNLFAHFKTIKSKIKSGDNSAIADLNQIKETYRILGLFKQAPQSFVSYYENKHGVLDVENEDIPAEIIALAEKRKEAKANKNYALSDSIRAEITEKGYALLDTKDGYTIKKA